MLKTEEMSLKHILPEILGPDLISVEDGLDMPTLCLYSSRIVRCLTLLRDHPRFLCAQLTDMTVVDYPGDAQRFHLVYHVLSYVHNMRLRIKIVTDTHPVPSIIGVFACANWYEREIWDLFGVGFVDHPDLRRLLTDYNFEGHPLRKDFPLSGYTQVRFDENLERVAYEPVQLSQDYRSFDFLSPWEGMLHARSLPGDEKAEPKPQEPSV